MIRRVIRVLVRLAGWLLTPLVVTLAAFLGATIAAMAAPLFPTTPALAIVVVAGLVSATVGLLLWIRLLRESPELQEALAVSPDGVPLDAEVDLLLSGAETSESGVNPP